MDRDFGSFPADLEPLVRRLIARDAKLAEAENPQQARLRGREITFYKNVWFGLIELTDGRRYYFLTRPKGGKGRLVPISNVVGAVDRANRQYALDLTKENVADYLNFYFSFTPKEDPMLSRISRGETQLMVPRTVADIEVDDGEERATPTGQPKCSDECLVRGAVWHFLDEGAPRARRASAVQAEAHQVLQSQWPHSPSVSRRGVCGRFQSASGHRGAGSEQRGVALSK